MGNIQKIFSEQLVHLRKQRGWTLEILAQRADMSPNGIHGLETGKRWPELETIRKLAAALAVPEERLFTPPDYVPTPTVPEALNTLCTKLGFHPPKPLKKRVKKT